MLDYPKDDTDPKSLFILYHISSCLASKFILIFLPILLLTEGNNKMQSIDSLWLTSSMNPSPLSF